MEKWHNKIKSITANHLDLPKDVVLDLPRITVIGFYQLYIENYKSITKFTDKFLILKLSKNEIKIVGEKLVIRKIWAEEILIEGIIREIYFID